MQLTVKLIDGGPSGRCWVLADAEGNVLPCQRGVEIEQNAGEMSTITVTFGIDGRDVRIAD